MSQEENGQGQDPNNPTPPSGEQKQVDLTKFASAKYNEGKEKQERDVLSKIAEISGNPFNSLDDAFNWVDTTAKKAAEGISDPTQTQEYKKLALDLQTVTGERDDLKSEVAKIGLNYTVDSTISEAFSELKENGEFVIPENQIKKLYQVDYTPEEVDGAMFVKNGSGFVLNGADKMTYKDSFKKFATDFMKSKAQGAGGASASGSASSGAKLSDYQKAVASNDHKRAEELLGAWAENGQKWADE